MYVTIHSALLSGVSLAAADLRGARPLEQSIELTPRQIAREHAYFSRRLPARCKVFVPFLPRVDFDASVDACARLTGLGMTPVPHIAARAFSSTGELSSALYRLRQLGVDSLFLIGGDIASPCGPFTSSTDVLASGLIERYGFRQIGFAAYPQGHPKLVPAELEAILSTKLAYARAANLTCFLVTQFVFSAKPIERWLNRPAMLACRVPFYIGIPGPARVRALLAYAVRCGVAESAKALRVRGDARAAWLGGWVPDDLAESVMGLSADRADVLDIRIHWFAFGGFEPTAGCMQKWL